MDDKTINTIKRILEVLAEEYPEDFRPDGYTQKGIQVMGIMAQLLSAPKMPMPVG